MQDYIGGGGGGGLALGLGMWECLAVAQLFVVVLHPCLFT